VLAMEVKCWRAEHGRIMGALAIEIWSKGMKRRVRGHDDRGKRSRWSQDKLSR
jgi:hypothetical protein